jgi:predicted HTH domain antitoxin
VVQLNPTMARSLTIPYDDSVLLETSLTRDEFEREAKLLLAAKLFERGRLSSGKAAELCGLGRVAFLLALPAIGVSISNLGPEDADDEAAFANRP